MNLHTSYLGLDLAHPIVASAGPISETLDGIRRLEDGGAAAIVMFSLFEEQIRQENSVLSHFLELGAHSSPEAVGYFPTVKEYAVGPDAYLDLIRRARDAVDVPIIASLNGTTMSGWTRYAQRMAQAGASALELNIFSIPADLDTTGREVEARTVGIVRAVRSAIDIPIAVKLSPFYSAMGEMACRLREAGANGLVLFNRFYQPDFDLEKREVVPSLELSSPVEIRLPLLWIAILHGRLPISLAATTGVETGREVAKYLLAGADVVMSTSALLRHGPEHLGILCQQLEECMDRQGYTSVSEMRGSMSQQNVADPTTFERANYIRILKSYPPDTFRGSSGS